MTKLCLNDIVEAAMRINVQVCFAMIEVHGEHKAHETQVVIAMQVAYENVTDPVKTGIGLSKLQLRTFATVDQEMTVLNIQMLCRRKASVCGYRSAGSEYG
jgi:hypothetical protein